MKVLVSMLGTQPVLSSGPKVCHSPVTGWALNVLMEATWLEGLSSRWDVESRATW